MACTSCTGAVLHYLDSTKHTWQSWWQDDIPCTGYSKSPVRTYIHDNVIGWHRYLCVSAISYKSHLEGSQPPRALAHSSLRNEKIKTATPWSIQHWGTSSHGVFQHPMHWLDVIPLAKSWLNLRYWKLSTKVCHDPQIQQFKTDRMHDADGWSIPGEVSPANNRSANIWIAEFNGIALIMDFERTPSHESTTHGNISKKCIVNNRCGYKSHLVMPP